MSLTAWRRDRQAWVVWTKAGTRTLWRVITYQSGWMDWLLAQKPMHLYSDPAFGWKVMAGWSPNSCDPTCFSETVTLQSLHGLCGGLGGQRGGALVEEIDPNSYALYGACGRTSALVHCMAPSATGPAWHSHSCPCPSSRGCHIKFTKNT